MQKGSSAAVNPQNHSIKATTTLSSVPLYEPFGQRTPLNVLVVDDDQHIRNVCGQILGRNNATPMFAETIVQAGQLLSNMKFDLLLLDLRLPDGSGLSLLRHAKVCHPDMAIVVMTAFATVSTAVEAMRIGASDYITKPFSVDEITTILQRASQRSEFEHESRLLRAKLQSQDYDSELIGRSREMDKLYRFISKVTFSTHPILLLGESGTGKRTLARSIHYHGPNSNGPFTVVDCACQSAEEIDWALFRTGPEKLGVGNESDGIDAGTVLISEIGKLPQNLQAKLVYALQHKKLQAAETGDAESLSARILASSSIDLPALIEQGRFRKDLFFRLNVVNLRIPPLRERKEDIGLLASHFLANCDQGLVTQRTFSNEVLELFMEYHWPGNVRELENAVGQAALLSSEKVLSLHDFPSDLVHFKANQCAIDSEGDVLPVSTRGRESTEDHEGNTIIPIFEMEKTAILATIRQLDGDKVLAAKMLGIGKTTLYRKLKEYGIEGLSDDSNAAH
jgi:two-component system response regulator HydG